MYSNTFNTIIKNMILICIVLKYIFFFNKSYFIHYIELILSTKKNCVNILLNLFCSSMKHLDTSNIKNILKNVYSKETDEIYKLIYKLNIL